MSEMMSTRRIGGGAQLRVNKGKWTLARRRKFLAELAQTMNVTASVRAVGCSVESAYALRKRDTGFAEAWREALCDAYEKVETLLLERALAGLGENDVAAGDTSRLEKLSERTLLSLLSHHRQAVTAHRATFAAAADTRLMESEAMAHAKLEAMLAEMAQRMDAHDAELRAASEADSVRSDG